MVAYEHARPLIGVGRPKSGAWKAHSRTGCITCKKRRVKCDETKPVCRRCSRYGHLCHGYAYPVFRAPAHIHQPASLGFRNEQENRYFALFRERIAPCLSIYFDSRLWDRLLLQACESHQPTRYAAIAIGALRKIDELRELPAGVSIPGLDDAHAHYKFAIQQYGQAVRLMQRDRINSIHDLRIVLVNCISIICFETLHQNYDAALRQVIVGLELLQDYHRRGNSTCQTIPDVEEEFIQAFGHLSIHAGPLNTPLLSDWYRGANEFKQTSPGTIVSDPQIVDQARMYLKQTTQQRINYLTDISPSQIMNCAKFDIFKWIPEEYTPKDAYIGEQRSDAGCEYSTLDKESVLDAMAIEIICQENRFESKLNSSLNKPSVDLSMFMPLFVRIISSARDALRHTELSPESGSYNLEMQAIFPLHTVIKYCPDVNLRNEARELSLLWQQRRDFVDGFQAGTLAEWIKLMAMAKWVT